MILSAGVPNAALAAQNGSPFEAIQQKSNVLKSSDVLQGALTDTPALLIKLPSPSDIILKDGALLFSAQVSNSRTYPVNSIHISAVLAKGQLIPITITDGTNGSNHLQQQYQAIPALAYDLPEIYVFKANESRSLQFKVPISIFLTKGNYDLQVEAKEQHGVVIGKSSVSLPLSLGQASGNLSIKKDSAQLILSSGQPLSTDQPLVAPAEVISIRAMTINNDALPHTAVPVLKIIPQNQAEGASEPSVFVQPSMTVAAGAEKAVTYSVPSQKLSGAYMVSLVLMDLSKSSALSYPVNRYYVVQGASASAAYQKYEITGQRILNSLIDGTVYIVGSADNKSHFTGTLVTTVLQLGTNEVLGQQSQAVAIDAGAPLASLNVHLAYNKPLSGVSDIMIRTQLMDSAGNILDTLQSVYYPFYSSRIILLILLGGLLVLILLATLLLALRKMKRRNFASNTVLVSFTVSATLVGLLISPLTTNAHPNISNQQDHHNDGLKWTLNNTGNGIGSQAVGGSSINGDQYTSYIAGANGGVAVSTLKVSPVWGNGWPNSYSGTPTTIKIYCNSTYYADANAKFFYTQYPTNASNISSYYDLCQGAAANGASAQIICPSPKPTSNYYDSSCYANIRSQTLPLVKGGNNPVALYGLPLPNGGYDYSSNNDGNTWQEAPRQFWFPKITPNVLGDLVACSANDAFNNTLGGVAGFGSITNNSSPYSFITDSFGNTIVWAATTYTQDGSFIFSVAACTGIHPGSYVGQTQIVFTMSENSYFYVGSPNGGNGNNGDSNYISNNYVASLIRIWGNNTRPANMGGDKDIYDFASHLTDGSWLNPSWKEYSPHFAAMQILHDNRDKTSADVSNFDTSQNWNVYVPANNPEMNIYKVCQRFAFYSYNPGNLTSANPTNAFFQGNQGLVNPVPTESADTYKTNYQNNCSPQPAPYPSAPFDYTLTATPSSVPTAGAYTLTYTPNSPSTKATQVIFYCFATDTSHSVNVDPASDGTAQYLGCRNSNTGATDTTVTAGAKGVVNGVVEPASNVSVTLRGTGPSSLGANLTVSPGLSLTVGSAFTPNVVATAAQSSHITRTDSSGIPTDICRLIDFNSNGGGCTDQKLAVGTYIYIGYACSTTSCASDSKTVQVRTATSGLTITASVDHMNVAPGEQFTITARRDSSSTASGLVFYTFNCGSNSTLISNNAQQNVSPVQVASVTCQAISTITIPTNIGWTVSAKEGLDSSSDSGTVKVVPQTNSAFVGTTLNYFCFGD